jgi:uncharacterized membrane protein YeaQ/YmgE (transglycosylase-associated protein family)
VKVQDRSFLIRVGAVKAQWPSKGQEPAGVNFFHRDPSRRTGYPVRQNSLLIKESVMGIIAWVVLGLVAGLLANLLVPGRRSQGLIVTCVIGILGALGGGWAATELFHVHTLHGFFNLSTWLTAIVGAAILLVIVHLFTTRGSTSGRRSSRRSGWARR